MTKISIFKHVKDNVPQDFDLDSWLQQTINPTKELDEAVEAYRQTFDKSLKERLPCATISASFHTERNLNNIVEKNKLICIDIDRHTKSKKKRCNQCVDMLLVKEMFMSHPCTLYCGYSVSGDGIYAIIRIHDENQLGLYFNLFRDNLSRIGINIDESCKDYTRLRFFSVDRDAYYNPDAKYYKAPEKAPERKPVAGFHVSKSDAEKVEKIISIISSTGMDITQSYDDWVKIGAALNDGFGESGLVYFHQVSSQHSDYDPRETDKKYHSCSKMNKIKLAAFFYVANSYGIRY